MLGLHRVKEIAIETAINARFSRYGTVTLHNCDFSRGLVAGIVHLKGENSAVEFSLSYAVIRKKNTLQVLDIALSKPWMQVLAQDFVVGKEHELGTASVFILELL